MKLYRKKSYEDSWINYLLIVLFCMNFLGSGSIFCLIFAVFALFRLKQIKIDKYTVYVFLFSLIVFFVSLFHFNLTESIKGFNHFFMYVIGYSGYIKSVDKDAFVKRTVFSIFAGYSLLIMLTYFDNRNLIYFTDQRLIRSFWTGEYVAATLIGLLCSVVIGYSFYALFCQKNKIVKLITAFSIIISFLINAQTATRTPIFLFFITISIVSVTYIANQRDIRFFRIIILASFVFIIGFIIYSTNAFGVKSYITSTPIFHRILIEGTETSRIEIAKMYHRHSVEFLWGGGKIHAIVGNSPHNFIQQGHDLYGIFATAILFVLGLSFVKNAFTFISFRKKTSFDYLFLSLYISMVIQSCLEPIFTGYPPFFFSLLLIHGMANGYLKNRKFG